MCSLAGFVSDRPIKFREELGRAMIVGGVRGDYSCGVWLDNGHYARALGTPGHFVYKGPYRSLWGTATMALAHTRWPTAGGMKKKDTQPYYHRAADVVTTHNGHVWGSLVEAAEEAAGVRCHNEVDSAIFKALLAGGKGIEGLAVLLGEASGPQAVAVRVQGAVYLATVGGQPLVWAARDGMIMWASMIEQIEAAMGKKVDIWSVPDNMVCVARPAAGELEVVQEIERTAPEYPWRRNVVTECGEEVDLRAEDEGWAMGLEDWVRKQQAKRRGSQVGCVLCGEPVHGCEGLCHWCAGLRFDEGDGRGEK